jgi:hypothetical protein
LIWREKRFARPKSIFFTSSLRRAERAREKAAARRFWRSRSFVITARDYADFARAIKAKLLHELRPIES